MKRAERRARTERIAKRRFRELENTTFGSELLPKSEGFFRKANSFTDKKKTTRLWTKIYKKKQEKLKDSRRNDDEDLD